MTSSEFMRVLARHWFVAALCAVMGVALALALALFIVTPSYSASVKLYVSGRGATADDRAKSGEYARTRMSSYADIVTSKEVLQEVRDELQLPASSAPMMGLARVITASNPLDTMIIDVTVQDPSPERARAVAAAIGEACDSVVARLESPSGKEQSPVRITTVSTPDLPIAQTTPNKKMYAGAGLFVGVAIGAGASWLLEMGQSRRRHREADPAAEDWWSWGAVRPSTSTTGERENALHVLDSEKERLRSRAQRAKEDESDAAGF